MADLWDGTPTPWQALGMATSNRSSDHLDFHPANDPCHLPESALRALADGPVSYGGELPGGCQEQAGKAWLVLWYQMCAMAADMLGICHYHTRVFNPEGIGFQEFSRLLWLNTGIEVSPAEIWAAAGRAFAIERRLNVREGQAGQGDAPALDGAALDAMLREYYSLQGWDSHGSPPEAAVTGRQRTLLERGRRSVSVASGLSGLRRHLHPQEEWEWPIAVYLYLAGFGAGAVAAGLLADWVLQPEIPSRAVLLWGPVFVAVGAPFLILDLGRKMRFLNAALNPRTSWAGRGFIILSTLILTGLAVFAASLLPSVLPLVGIGSPAWLDSGSTLFRALEIVVFVFAIGTAAYTGIFLKSTRYVALWNTWLLPVLFLVSALSTGTMGIVVALLGYGSIANNPGGGRSGAPPHARGADPGAGGGGRAHPVHGGEAPGHGGSGGLGAAPRRRKTEAGLLDGHCRPGHPPARHPRERVLQPGGVHASAVRGGRIAADGRFLPAVWRRQGRHQGPASPAQDGRHGVRLEDADAACPGA